MCGQPWAGFSLRAVEAVVVVSWHHGNGGLPGEQDT